MRFRLPSYLFDVTVLGNEECGEEKRAAPHSGADILVIDDLCNGGCTLSVFCHSVYSAHQSAPFSVCGVHHQPRPCGREVTHRSFSTPFYPFFSTSPSFCGACLFFHLQERPSGHFSLSTVKSESVYTHDTVAFHSSAMI